MERPVEKITSIEDCVTLNNGVRMPWFGLGVFLAEEGPQVEEAVSQALEAGYRSIDTAAVYGNEKGVGRAVRNSGIPREQIFITTKVWNTDMRQGKTREAFEESLSRLDMDYVDLYLIHWPVREGFIEPWQVLESIYESGRIRAIGVSNFLVHHLEALFEHGHVVPAVNQVEFHPYLRQPRLMAFCRNNQIQLEAWSPLMQGRIVDVPEIRPLAEKYGKSPVQIVLRWDLQHGVVTIPKTVRRDRILSNADIFDFELSGSDMRLIDALDREQRFGAHPDKFPF
ncbi:aldo/keto reductase [bacterium]|nr:aldo/keto reductase [bacterium]